eukprot:Sdes_comp18097_c0_seq2m7530
MGHQLSIMNAGLLEGDEILDIHASNYHARVLNLDSVGVKEIFPGFCNLLNPKEIYLMNNHLKQLPLDISFFSNLKILDLSYNKYLFHHFLLFPFLPAYIPRFFVDYSFFLIRLGSLKA